MIEYLIELKDHPDYFITESGNVYSGKFGKMIKMKAPSIKTGYLVIQLRKNGERCHNLVHRLVAKTFIPNPENKPCVDHIDRNVKNNKSENLRWVSHKENSRNQTKHKNNKSGVLGVCYHNNNWIAQCINNEGERKLKCFSQNKYPNAKELAIEHRKEMERLFYPTLTNL